MLKLNDTDFEQVCSLFTKSLASQMKIIRKTISMASISTTESCESINSESISKQSPRSKKQKKNPTETQCFWNKKNLFKYASNYKEKLKDTIKGKIGNDNVVVIDVNLRPVSFNTFIACSNCVSDCLVMYLCACITTEYINENYLCDMENDDFNKAELIDNIAMEIVSSFATKASKKTFVNNDSESASESCRKTRDNFLIPEDLLKLLKDKICFKGTIEEFEACLGWLFTKHTKIKGKNKKYYKFGKSSPFSYQNYRNDLEKMEQVNQVLSSNVQALSTNNNFIEF